MRCRVDHRVPAQILPDSRQHIDMRKGRRAKHQIRHAGIRPANRPVDVGENAKSGVAHLGNHAADYDNRDEVWHVGHRLYEFALPAGSHGIEHQRKQNRQREPDNETVEGQSERIHQNLLKVIG